MDPPSYSSSSMVDPDISIEFDSLSSPMLERPSTLPELNSRPASRVMKSFSCQGVSLNLANTSHFAMSLLLLMSMDTLPCHCYS